MKVYFAGSIRAGRQDSLFYRHILEEIKKHGEVLTEHIGDDGIIEKEEKKMSDQEIFERDMRWIEESDILIAEVTVPSLGVGYEIAKAVELGKKVICLFRGKDKKNLSAIINGCNEVIIILYENIDQAKDAIAKHFSSHSSKKKVKVEAARI